MSLENSVTQLEQTNANLVKEVVRVRDIVMGMGNIFKTVTEGRQTVSDGKYFVVPGDGSYMRLYRREGASAELIADYPSVDEFENAALLVDSIQGDKAAVSTMASEVSANAADAIAAKNAAVTAKDQAVAIAGGDAQPIFDTWVVDVERRNLEAATGGACTIERTANGQASYMFVLPKMKWEDLVPSGELGTGIHEAFMVNGVEKSELLVGMFQAASVNGELVSQARKVPRRSINWDDSRSEAQAAGFDMMGNWEWSAIAMWCMANGFQPRGNTDYGQSHSHPHEHGVNVEYDNIATGSGPNAFNHNNAANGIADLVGNIWEWQWGFKMVDGRIFIAPDNDRALAESAWADSGYDMPTASSTNWGGLAKDAPQQLQRALIMPNGVADPDGSLWTNLDGERFPSRGGTRSVAGHAGLGALFLSGERTTAYHYRGLRLTRLV